MHQLFSYIFKIKLKLTLYLYIYVFHFQNKQYIGINITCCNKGTFFFNDLDQLIDLGQTIAYNTRMYLNLKCFEKSNAFALMRMNMTIAHDVNYIKSFHSGLQKTEQYDISWVFMRSTCVVVSLLQILKILNRQLTIEINYGPLTRRTSIK